MLSLRRVLWSAAFVASGCAFVVGPRLLASGDAPPSAAAASNRVIAWNNLGMHCEDDDFSLFSLLPPYNTVVAQVVRQGSLVTNPTGLTVTYKAVADPAGSINRTSAGKSNFWDHVFELFGANLAVDQGLAGKSMPGAANDEFPMSFDPSLDAFVAEGIPITPYDDAQKKNYYPMFRVSVRDASNQVIATTDTVLPVSDEMTCLECHGSKADDSAKPAAGWANDPDWKRDYRLNILRLHDEKNAANPAYSAALAALGFDANGLYSQATGSGAVLCGACHATNALGTTGQPNIKSLTAALHLRHAMVKDPSSGQTLNDIQNRTACYQCHPGSVTKCLRGAMGAAVADDGSMAMQCQSCHGTMTDVGDTARVGWLDEPSCQQCHTGTATQNSGKIRFTSAFDANGNPHVPANSTFATNANTPAPGFDLYRFSKGHGGLQCEACHGSTHAEYPSLHTNDNVQSIALQGHEGTISECSTCHASVPMTSGLGPHGMHPVGQAWVNAHGEEAEAEDSGPGECKTCHGADLKGTVLSRSLGDRTLGTEWGPKTFWRGFEIGCYTCHNGPSSETGSSNKAPQTKNASLVTDELTPQSIDLYAKDPDGDALELRIVSQPSHGTVGLTGKTATYFPEAGFAGVETFTYAARDGKTDSNLGTVTVQVIDVVCPASLAAESTTFAAAGGNGTVDLTLESGCDWTAAVTTPGATWLVLTGATIGTGNSSIPFSVAANTAESREATLEVAGETVIVKQAGTNSPDLIGAFKKTKVDCNAQGVKCRLGVRLEVTNVGSGKAKKSRVEFWLSSDPNLDANDTLIGSDAVPALAAGDSYKANGKIAVASPAAVAGMYVIAKLDADGKVLEVIEADDIVVSNPIGP